MTDRQKRSLMTAVIVFIGGGLAALFPQVFSKPSTIEKTESKTATVSTSTAKTKLSNSISGRQTVTFIKNVDGDTTWFSLDGTKTIVRYLAIDTRETKNSAHKKAEKIGFTASDYVKKTLTNAKKIQLEFESSKTDKYGRTLAWVWVDNKLLQKDLVKRGLAEVKYIYGKYKYTDQLKAAQAQAKKKRLGIWK